MAGVFQDIARHCVLMTSAERVYTYFVHNDGSGSVLMEKLEHEAFNRRFKELDYDPARMARRFLDNRAITPIIGRANAAITAVLNGEKGTTMATAAPAKKTATAAPAPKGKAAPAAKPEPKAKATKAPAEKGERRGRTSRYAGKNITLLVKENPKREGTAAYERFELYSKHKTTDAFLAAGGTSSTLAYDVEHEYIKLS